MKKIFICGLLLFVVSLSGKTLFRAVLDRGFVPPGGVVPFTVTVIHPPRVLVIGLSTNRSHPDLEFGKNAPTVVETGDGRKQTVISGTLQVFSISNIVFDGFRIHYQDSGITNSRVLGQCGITVITPPVDTKRNPLILPAKGPLEYKFNPLLLILVSLFVILGALLFYWYYRRKKAMAPRIIPGLADAVDPWDLVRKRLDFLRDRIPATETEIKDYYFELTETVRMYLTGRTGLRFEESTTSELKLLLPSVPWISGGAGETLTGLFMDADLVKFARFHPEESVIATFFGSIETLLTDIDADFSRHNAILRGGGRDV